MFVMTIKVCTNYEGNFKKKKHAIIETARMGIYTHSKHRNPTVKVYTV